MTLKEAIEHAEKVAETQEEKCKHAGHDHYTKLEASACAAEHRRLAEWLRELQERRKQPEIIHCKDCIKGKYHNLAKSTMCMLHPFNPVRVEPDGFCKWSERRTDEHI